MVPRVLTVEDEPDLRLILQDNLEFEGYEVLSAATGEEGLDIAMAKQPDLVLLDLLLPRMSGYEVCRRLRAEQLDDADHHAHGAQRRDGPRHRPRARRRRLRRQAVRREGAAGPGARPAAAPARGRTARRRGPRRRGPGRSAAAAGPPRPAAARPVVTRVRAAGVPARSRRSRRHPRGAAARGLGLQCCTSHPHRRQFRRQAAQEGRARPAQSAPHPDRARLGVPPRADGRRRDCRPEPDIRAGARGTRGAETRKGRAPWLPTAARPL